MNKKLLTAAIGAALAAGPMLAQADVKLYGKIHVSADYLDAKAAAVPHTSKSTNIANNTSRWGIDVSEKLGGGLTAIGKLESQIDATGDNTTDTATSQNRYVGLSGKFGTLLAGVHDTPFKEIMAGTNLFTDQVGDSRNIIRQNAGSGMTAQATNAAASTSVSALRQSTYDWDARTANSIRYQTPAMNGFKLTYQWSADVTTSTTAEDNRRKVSSLSLAYSSGPLYAAYAYETHKMVDANTGTGAPAAGTGVGDGDPTESGQRLGFGYNFGSFKVLALYQSLKNLGGKRTTDNEVNRSSWGLGGAYTAGNNVFKAQYYKANKFNQNYDGSSSSDTAANMWALGWDHLFSKTAKAYVAYAKTTNQTNTIHLVTGGGHGDQVTPSVGGDPSVWSVGMILDF